MLCTRTNVDLHFYHFPQSDPMTHWILFDIIDIRYCNQEYVQILQQVQQKKMVIFNNPNKVAPETDDHIQHIQNDLTLTFPNIQPPQALATCRICWEQANKSEMISPCLCTGSIEKVHEKCMMSWIYKQMKMDNRVKVNCEICLQKISFQMSAYLEWRPQYFCRNVPYINSCMFGILLGGLLILSILSILIASKDQSMMGEAGKIIVISGLAIDSIIVVVVLVLIFRRLLTEKKHKIVKVHNRTFQRQYQQSEQSSQSHSRTSRVSSNTSSSHN